MKLSKLLWFLAVVLTSMILLSGCAKLAPSRGEGYQGDDATWGKSLRSDERQRESMFFNEKSRQIEESLGM